MLTCKSKLRYLIFYFVRNVNQENIYVYFHSSLFLYDSYIFRFVELFQSLNFISVLVSIQYCNPISAEGEGVHGPDP